MQRRGSEEINIASNTETSIGQVARMIINQINPEAKVIGDEQRLRPDKSEVERLVGANDKIMDLTNWRPAYCLEEGLSETITWFSEDGHSHYYKPDIYNV